MFESLKISLRGLSPIFATLIILAVVTVLFIPVFIWSTGLSAQTEETWQYSGKVASERITIEMVDLQVGQSNCIIYVRNIGATAITINDIIISKADGSGVHIFNKGDFELNTNDPIVKGKLVEITIPDLGFSPLALNTYTVKVFTSLGVSDNYDYNVRA